MPTTAYFKPDFGNLGVEKRVTLKGNLSEILGRSVSFSKVAEIYRLMAGEYRRWAKVKKDNTSRRSKK